MVRKKTVQKKKKRSSRKSKSFKTELKKAITGLGILVALVIVAGILTHHFFLRQPALKSVDLKKESEFHPVVVHKAPPFEVFPDEAISPPKIRPSQQPASLKKPLPPVAIIIDDLGYQMHLAEEFIHLDAVLTFSVLPYSPYQEQIATLVKARGFEVMLHLPMEPFDYPNIYSGPGTLLTTMTPDELIDQLNADLAAVPFISGVNNHMGSKMTANSDQMYQIFTILKKKRLFYVDSRTTAESIGKPSARLFQVPFSERDVFLDHVQESDVIKKQIQHLVQVAYEKGQAIGIAHPYPMTYDVLLEELPNLKKDVQLVSASELVAIVH